MTESMLRSSSTVIIGLRFALTSAYDRLKFLIVIHITTDGTSRHSQITIPRILKGMHKKAYGKPSLLTAYEIISAKVPPGLNISQSDCGVYSLKYIECHMLQLRMDLMNDDNIPGARHKCAVDLWEAANDPVFVEIMENSPPPVLSSDDIVDLEKV